MAKKGMSVGVDEEVERLLALSDSAEDIASYALYAGADAVANAVKAAIRALPVDDNPRHPFSGPLRVITEEDRSAMAAGVGISRHYDTSDGRGVSIGLNGYSPRKEKRFPNGVPLVMIARSIESGSSARGKNPFWRRAERASSSQVEKAMQEAANEIVDKIAQNQGG